MAPETRSEQLFVNTTATIKRRVHQAAQANGVSDSKMGEDLIVRALAPRQPQHVGNFLAGVLREWDAAGSVKSDTQLQDLIRAADLTSDLPGLLPNVVTAELIKQVDAVRHVVNVSRQGLGPLPMPPTSGNTFTVPRFTTTTSADEQTTQNTGLSSTTAVVAATTVTKKTYGGALDLTEQDNDWTDEPFLQTTYEDLAEQYATRTEKATCAAVEAAVTTNHVATPSSWANVLSALTALIAANAQVRTNSLTKGDVFFCGSAVWDLLVASIDSSNRPVGLELLDRLGLTPVYSNGFTASFAAVAASRHLRTWEQNKGGAALLAPSTLKLTAAYRGYFSANMDAAGICGFA